MRRRNYEPFHVECRPNEPGFALEFYVSDTERVTLQFPLWWGPALVQEVMKAQQHHELEVKRLRERIVSAVNG